MNLVLNITRLEIENVRSMADFINANKAVILDNVLDSHNVSTRLLRVAYRVVYILSYRCCTHKA